MTVQQDLQKAVANAKQSAGTYATMGESTQDQSAKQMFKQMEQDMERHEKILQSRLDYLNQHNQLNVQQQQKQQQQAYQAQQELKQEQPQQ